MDNESSKCAISGMLYRMPKSPTFPESLRGKIFPKRTAAKLGLSKWQLRNAMWQHLFTEVYADSAITVDHALRAYAAMLRIPAAAAIGSYSAAWLWGAKLLEAQAPVHVIVPREHKFGPVKGLRILTLPLSEDEVDYGPDNLRVTTPERTAWDIARDRDIVEAVATLDALTAARVIHMADLQNRLEQTQAWGRRRAAKTIALIDPRAESPQESRLRVRLVLAGLPVPISQHNIHGARGEFIARVDLAWPEHRIAIEYDGHWHGNPRQLRRDRRRLNRLIAADWRVFHVTDDRLKYDFAKVIGELARLL